MTPTQRRAALRLVDNMNLSLETWIEQAENLLRELLAAEPVQEPVAWGVFVDDELFKPFNCKDEAVDWFQAQYNHGSRYDYLVLPLYTAPQQRRPLSDEQINRLDRKAIYGGSDSQYAFRFARAIERAHGITGEPT